MLSLMSHSSHTESRVHVAASLQKLSTYLDDSGSQSRTFQEVGGRDLSLLALLSSALSLLLLPLLHSIVAPPPETLPQLQQGEKPSGRPPV